LKHQLRGLAAQPFDFGEGGRGREREGEQAREERAGKGGERGQVRETRQAREERAEAGERCGAMTEE
jgi:hypothetical protein